MDNDGTVSAGPIPGRAGVADTTGVDATDLDKDVSPRERDQRRCAQRPGGRPRYIPARAGVADVSGQDGINPRSNAGSETCSPHSRCSASEISPARAGMGAAHPAIGGSRRRDPRVSGSERIAASLPAARSGTSPQHAGARVADTCRGDRRGSIPARAGVTTVEPVSLSSLPDRSPIARE